MAKANTARGVELNIDGLVGPTHNYAGLAHGNVASETHKNRTSNPRAAALQGLAKMRRLMSLGLPQAVMPPQERPNIAVLRNFGFDGSDEIAWQLAFREAPQLARMALSASSMWAANAATVSPSADCKDRRLHVSVANLAAHLHRQLEAEQTYRALSAILPAKAGFKVHPALPANHLLGDEGAANHMRLAAAPDAPGVEVFVYGGAASDPHQGRYRARQTLEASQAIARRHNLNLGRTAFIRQGRAAIDAGVFHNDVVAVAHENVLFFHERAYENRRQAIIDICVRAEGLFEPQFVEVPEARVPLEDAVSSYLFNAQLVREPGANRLTLVLPSDAVETASTRRYLEDLTTEGPIGRYEIFDLKESMRNGGGPACLRLRVQLTAEEYAKVPAGFLLTHDLCDRLETWVNKHYRDRLAPPDLADPALIEEGRAALDELSQILPLGPDFYPFQRAGLEPTAPRKPRAPRRRG